MRHETFPFLFLRSINDNICTPNNFSLSRERFPNLNPSFLSLQMNKEPHLFHQRLHGEESIYDRYDEPGRILFLLVLVLFLPHGPIYRLAHPLAACRCKAPRSSLKEILSSSIWIGTHAAVFTSTQTPRKTTDYSVDYKQSNPSTNHIGG